LLVSHENVHTWEEKSISKVATWRNLYTVYDGENESDFFESDLDEKIENKIPKIIEKIKKNKKLTRKQLIYLMKFVSVQAYRTPAGYIKMQKMIENFMPDILDDLGTKMMKTKPGELENIVKNNNDIDQSLIPLSLEIEEQKSLIKLSTIIGRETYLQGIKEVSRNKAFNILLTHNWRIIRPAKGLYFPTSDNPVINLNYYRKDKYDFNGGWGVDNTCIMMPLTPKHLLYTQVGYNGSIKHLDKSIEWTNFFVKLITENARRKVYFHKTSKEIARIRPRTVNSELFEFERKQYNSWSENQIKAIDSLK